MSTMLSSLLQALVVVALVYGIHAAAEDDFDKWQHEDNLVTPYISTKHTVSHLEEDQFVAGNILFSEYQALLTTNGQSSEVIVGQHGFWPIYDYQEGIGTNATFRTISSFAQLNRTDTLIADRDNGCIRSLNRLTDETSHFSGICEHLKGFSKPAIDGSRFNATFWKINSLTLYKTTLYIVESNSQRIRALDLADDCVRTVITADNFTHSHHLPRVIVANWDTDILYVTTRYGIGQYDPSSDNFTYMVKSPQSGFRDGNLLESKWSYNDGMVLLPNNSLIVADVNNNRLRIVDLISNNVTTWCFRYPKAFQNCSITKPKALRLINCTLFISNSQLISTLTLPPWSCGNEIRNDWINIVADWIVNNQDKITIVCSVIGGAVAIALISGVVFYFVRRRQSADTNVDASVQYNTFAAGQEEHVMYKKAI